MLRYCLLILFYFIGYGCFAQRQFPVLTTNIDSIFDICSNEKITNEQKLSQLAKVDDAINSLEPSYPLFRGIVYMYEAFHAPPGVMRLLYNKKGVALISSNKKMLADSFSSQCNQLLDYYWGDKRTDEWLAVDSILRSTVSSGKNDWQWCILTYADKKLNEGSFRIAKNLASYNLLFCKTRNSFDAPYLMELAFAQYIINGSKYREWLNVPYYKRNESFSLKNDFRELFSVMGVLKDSIILNNEYGSKKFDKSRRSFYYSIYKNAVLDYAGWCINDHREGQAILPLKNFLLRDLIPNEMLAASKANATAVVSASDIINLYSKLAELYINIGDGTNASDVTKRGIDFITGYKRFNEDDVFKGGSFLLYLNAKAKRVEGKYEASLKTNTLLKKWWPLPASVSKDNIEQWNWFIETRLQEVYTLIAQHKNEAAGDSLNLLTEKLAPLDSTELLYKSYQWPQLQFASMQYMARLGKWNVVSNYLLEALTIVEQDNHWENVSYYYDMQLLYFIAEYRTKKIIRKNIVANLLFYTGRHLQHTFFMLTPEDRIRLYENKLSTYFDVYHELLLNHLLDDEPALKEKIIEQSLYLKNALIDANLLPNQYFANKDDTAKIKFIEQIRESRNKTNLLISEIKMISSDDFDMTSYDQIQSLWLGILDNANFDSLVRFNGWKKIAASLQSKQVYAEVVRYTKWLSDSASTYAAYVIKDGKLNIVNLFDESKIIKLLKDPSSSPQSGSLNANNNRGLSLTKADKKENKFKPGSEDKLGSLVLSPLWQFLENKEELLIVPDGLMNRISLPALQFKGQSLFSKIRLHQLSGSYVLYQSKEKFPANAQALLAGGLNYGDAPDQKNINRLLNKNYNWQYLPSTKKEIENLEPIFKSANINVSVLTGYYFQDTLRNELTRYNFIHFATHGFYVDSSLSKIFYNKIWSREAIQNDAMLRCGIAVSSANFPDVKNVHSIGHLLGFELANTDLRNCYLVSLSACETGLGDLRNNLGVDGLPRALKLGGAKYLLISLWKVPDAPTAVFMQQFYKELFRQKNPAAALQSTQTFMSRQYTVADWAAFVLVE